MLFDKKYSNFNKEILKIEKPECKDYNVKSIDVQKIYSSINQSIEQTNNLEKYNGEGNDGLIASFLGICLIFSFIIALIINQIAVSIGCLIIGSILLYVGKSKSDAYKEKVKKRENKYKELKEYNLNMEHFIKDNDSYNDKVENIKIPLIKEMTKLLQEFNHSQLKLVIVKCYQKLGYNISSTGIRKFGGVILKTNKENINSAIVIFPYDNKISGNTIQYLSEPIRKIKNIDFVNIFTKHGEYSYGLWSAKLLFKPFKVYNAYDLAMLIWDANNLYYSSQNNDEKKKNTKTKNNNIKNTSISNIIEKNGIKVESSNISFALFDESTLYIKFKNNDIYAYHNIDEKIYNEFLTSPSKGKFVVHVLNSYPYEKIKNN